MFIIYVFWGRRSLNYKQLRNRVQAERVLNERNVFMRTKYLVCRTRISLDGGRTLKSWVAFRALVIGHLS